MRSSKASSYVVASIVLVIVAVAVGMIVYTFMGKEGENVKNTDTQAESVVIEQATVKDGLFLVWVRNIGREETLITDAYLVAKDGTLLGRVDIPDTPLKPGEVKRITMPPLLISGLIEEEENAKLVLGGPRGLVMGGGGASLSPSQLSSSPLLSGGGGFNPYVTVGMLIDRRPPGNDPDLVAGLNNMTNFTHINITSSHWFYINLLTGAYKYSFKKHHPLH